MMPPLLTLKAALCELRGMSVSGEDEVRKSDPDRIINKYQTPFCRGEES